MHNGLAVNFRRTSPGVPQIVGSCACSVTGTAINNDIVLTGIMASVTRLSLGEYQFNFVSPMPDINYFFIGNVVPAADFLNSIGGYIQGSAKLLTTGFQLEFAQMNVALKDPAYIRILVFR